MVLRWTSNYIISLLIICFSVFVHHPISLAEVGDDSKQQAFLNFEKKVSNLIVSSMEPLNKLNKLDGKINEEGLYNITLMAKDEFTKNSLALAKLKTPAVLPEDINVSLEKVKVELSIGFKAMEESMDYLAQYMVNRNPILYNKYIEKHEKGLLYINGGLTSLTTVRLRLNASKKSISNKQLKGSSKRRSFYNTNNIAFGN